MENQCNLMNSGNLQLGIKCSALTCGWQAVVNYKNIIKTSQLSLNTLKSIFVGKKGCTLIGTKSSFVYQTLGYNWPTLKENINEIQMRPLLAPYFGVYEMTISRQYIYINICSGMSLSSPTDLCGNSSPSLGFHTCFFPPHKQTSIIFNACSIFVNKTSRC